MNTSKKTQTPKRNFITIVDVLVSAGAAVVIFAAWAKLTHKPFADAMLTWGMWTETGIFLVYAVIEWVRPQPHPKHSVDDDDRIVLVPTPQETGNPALNKMEEMMEKAGINPTNLQRLSDSFQKLDTTVGHLGDIGDVVRSTSDFSAKTNEASHALGQMKDAFLNSANTMGSFNSAAESAKGFHEQVQVLTKNLGSLNSIYELELKESNSHLKSLNQYYSQISQATEVMVSTVSDAQSAKDQMNILANNLGKLNQVYGNMLSAMQGRQ